MRTSTTVHSQSSTTHYAIAATAMSFASFPVESLSLTPHQLSACHRGWLFTRPLTVSRSQLISSRSVNRCRHPPAFSGGSQQETQVFKARRCIRPHRSSQQGDRPYATELRPPGARCPDRRLVRGGMDSDGRCRHRRCVGRRVESRDDHRDSWGEVCRVNTIPPAR
jgi:hypothetical protein